MISALNDGAYRAIVPKNIFDEIHHDGQLEDLSRLIMALDGPEQIEEVSAIHPYLSFHLDKPTDTNALEAPAKLYVSLANDDAEALASNIKANRFIIFPSSSPLLQDKSKIILAALYTDRPDGLYTTLVSDERGICLGLVYSSTESVRESLKTGRGVYQSRSRGLWYKGDTSGDIQELLRIDLDCDGDALLYTVRQKGDGKS